MATGNPAAAAGRNGSGRRGLVMVQLFPKKRMRCATCLAAAVFLTIGGCRSAVVVTKPNDPNTQTVVTVEQRPTTSPSDKHLIVREK